MSKSLVVWFLICSSATCAVPADDELVGKEAEYDSGEQEEAARSEGGLEERLLLAEASEVSALIKAGLPLPGEEGYIELSAYQRHQEVLRLGSRDSGVLLGRMTVSEGTPLMPLRASWPQDMQGILQVVRNNKGPDEHLFEALGRHSPHVARIKEYTRPRQRWTSTLPAKGSEAPEFWEECTSWETLPSGKRVRRPEGCNGTWAAGSDNWDTVRAYGIKLVKMPNAPKSVQGNPKTWGGKMDIARFLELNPNMCWLESGDTRNYFFGLKDDPENRCKRVPEELLEISRSISVQIMKRDMERRSRERRQ